MKEGYLQEIANRTLKRLIQPFKLLKGLPMTSRRNGVIELRKAGLSYAAIGRRLNISRERARQIAKGKPSPRKASGVMLTTSGVAQLLGVHPNTVRHWANRGILKSCRIGPRADRRFRRGDMDALLKEQ